MNYVLNLDQDGRILSATFEAYAAPDAVVVTELPEGDISDYRYEKGVFVHDPLPVVMDVPTQLDRIEAQVVYTAMMTDTLLEV